MAEYNQDIVSAWQLTTGGAGSGIVQIDHIRINALGTEWRATFGGENAKVTVREGITQLHADMLEFIGHGDKVEYSVSGNKHRTIVLADGDNDKVCHIYEIHLRHGRAV